MVHGDRFFLVLRTGSGVLHEEELDFNALIHDIAFAGVSDGRLENDGRWEPVVIEPEWTSGRFEGVTVTVAGLSRTYGRAAFQDRAVEILWSKGILREVQTELTQASWNVERRDPAANTPNSRHVTVRHRPYPLTGNTLVETGTDRLVGADGGVSIRISRGLLAELHEASANSLDRERADFLVGLLVRDTSHRAAVALFSRIPAGAGAESSLIHYSFSPVTFLAAQRELESRGSNHVILGWHHNHPPPCGYQCLSAVPPCGTDNVVFSVDDRMVHRSAFGRPYMVGLVCGKGPGRRADDPLIRAYGWHRGRICEREWSVF